MYKLLLCWRYLRTRYIALICIVSIMLGVATLIVTNAVMAGFADELQIRTNGMLGDVIVDARSLDGVFDADAHIARIRQLAGNSIQGITPTAKVPAILTIETESRQKITSQIMLFGIDETTYAEVSSFGEYLQHPKNRDHLSFDLHERGYDLLDSQSSDSAEAKPRINMEKAGWVYRREVYAPLQRQRHQYLDSRDPFSKAAPENDLPQGEDFNHSQEQHVGIVLGYGLASLLTAKGDDYVYACPGIDVAVSFPNASLPPKAISENYTVVDLFESGLEFDANFAFVPLKNLQKSRGLIDPTTGVGKFNSIMIKLKPDVDANEVRDVLRNEFPAQLYSVNTWRDQRSQLLQAIQMETMLLNILLFMIIAVAGFGIFAIFLMIVVEKTRDIGILKSLGASAAGVMGIFLTYGLTLGIVGSIAGLGLGLLLERNINVIKDWISGITGTPVFDPSVYFFNQIPTQVYPITVLWVCLGAIAIAVLSSVFPAWRAAKLHPVRALRYE